MRSPLLALLPIVVACSSTPAPVEPSPAAPSASPATPASGVAAAPASAALPVASASAAPLAAPAHEAPPAAPEPAALTPAEQKDTQRLCKPLMSAMAKAKGKSEMPPTEALAAALAKPPPSMKPADVERCRDLLGRGIRGYVAAAREVEARVILAQIALRAVGAYRETGKLCPDAAPVPADRALVAKGPYESTAADWASPGWACLHFSFEGQPQRFQYEMHPDADGKGFELLARGVPGENGRFVTLAQRGKISDKGIEVGGVERR